MANRIIVNLDTSKSQYDIYECKQNDDLILEANIFENGIEKDISNAMVTINCARADGTYAIQNTDITKGKGKVIANLKKDFTRVDGLDKLEIVLLENEKQNTTFDFNILVKPSVLKTAVEESKDTVIILEELGNKIVEAGQVKAETENLIATGNAATKGDVAKINSSLEQKANLTDLTNDRIFKGADIATNILLKTDTQGSYWYATDEKVYYLRGASEWINIGFGDNVSNAILEPTIGTIKQNTYLSYTGKEVALTGNKTKTIIVKENDKLMYSCNVGGAIRAYAMYDKQWKMISIYPSSDLGAGLPTQNYNGTFIVPKDVYYVIVCNGEINYIPKIVNHTEELTEIKKNINIDKNTIKALKDITLVSKDTTITKGKYLVYTGSIGTISNESYEYSKVNINKNTLYVINCSCVGLQRAYSIKNLDTGEVTIYPNNTGEQLEYTEYIDKVIELDFDAELTLSSYSANGVNVSIFEKETSNAVDIVNNEYYKYLLNQVMCIGDSLTRGAYYGFGVNGSHIKEGYPHFLGKMNEWITINAGKSGATPLSWWVDVKPTIDSQISKTDTFIIWLGTNQGLTDTIEADTSSGDWNTYAETNTGYYCKIIEYIKSIRPNANIFLCNIYTTTDVITTNNVINKIALKYGLPVFNMNDGTLWQGENQNILHPFNNAVHFGKIGNVYIANKLTNYISEYISKNPTEFEEIYIV